MRKSLNVSPLEIRDYAASYGWVAVQEALRDGLFVLNSPKRDFRQLVFPIDPSREEYEAMALNALQRLAVFLGKAESEIVEEIREVNDDVISLRYYSDSKIVNSMLFEEALKAMATTRQMLLSAGSTVVSPLDELVEAHKQIAKLNAALVKEKNEKVALLKSIKGKKK